VPGLPICVLQQRLRVDVIDDSHDHQPVRSHHFPALVSEDLPDKVHHSPAVPGLVHLVSYHGEFLFTRCAALEFNFLSVFPTGWSLGRTWLPSRNLLVHNPQKARKITAIIHLFGRLSPSLLHYYPLVLVHLQHRTQTARKAEQIRLDTSKQEQTKVFPEQKRSSTYNHDARHFSVLYDVLFAVDDR
jgi:hypothetical protein